MCLTCDSSVTQIHSSSSRSVHYCEILIGTQNHNNNNEAHEYFFSYLLEHFIGYVCNSLFLYVVLHFSSLQFFKFDYVCVICCAYFGWTLCKIMRKWFFVVVVLNMKLNTQLNKYFMRICDTVKYQIMAPLCSDIRGGDRITSIKWME